jgi:hypothetical protein
MTSSIGAILHTPTLFHEEASSISIFSFDKTGQSKVSSFSLIQFPDSSIFLVDLESLQLEKPPESKELILKYEIESPIFATEISIELKPLFSNILSQNPKELRLVEEVNACLFYNKIDMSIRDYIYLLSAAYSNSDVFFSSLDFIKKSIKSLPNTFSISTDLEIFFRRIKSNEINLLRTLSHFIPIEENTHFYQELFESYEFSDYLSHNPLITEPSEEIIIKTHKYVRAIYKTMISENSSIETAQKIKWFLNGIMAKSYADQDHFLKSLAPIHHLLSITTLEKINFDIKFLEYLSTFYPYICPKDHNKFYYCLICGTQEIKILNPEIIKKASCYLLRIYYEIMDSENMTVIVEKLFWFLNEIEAKSPLEQASFLEYLESFESLLLIKNLEILIKYPGQIAILSREFKDKFFNSLFFKTEEDTPLDLYRSDKNYLHTYFLKTLFCKPLSIDLPTLEYARSLGYFEWFKDTYVLAEFLLTLQSKSEKERAFLFEYLSSLVHRPSDKILLALAKFPDLDRLEDYCRESIANAQFWDAFDKSEHQKRILHLLNFGLMYGFNAECLVLGDEDSSLMSSLITSIPLISESSAITRESFKNIAMFKYTRGNEWIFNQLWLVRFHPNFHASHMEFLINLQSLDWFEKYRDLRYAMQGSCLAILDYLTKSEGGSISFETLINVLLVGGALSYREKFESMELRTISAEELPNLCEEYGYAPFAINDRLSLKKDRSELMEEVLKTFSLKPPSERIAFFRDIQIMNFPDLDRVYGDSDWDTHFNLKINFGTSKAGDKACFFSPFFMVNHLIDNISIYKSSFEGDHNYMLGHNPNYGSIFYEKEGARPFSIASVLAPIRTGPHSFYPGDPGMTMASHDLYHCYITSFTPYDHRNLLREVAIAFNRSRTTYDRLIKKQPLYSTNGRLSNYISRLIADLEPFTYSKNNHLLFAFWEFLAYYIFCRSTLNNLPIRFITGLQPHHDWINTIAIPVLVEVLRKSALSPFLFQETPAFLGLGLHAELIYLECRQKLMPFESQWVESDAGSPK